MILTIFTSESPGMAVSGLKFITGISCPLDAFEIIQQQTVTIINTVRSPRFRCASDHSLINSSVTSQDFHSYFYLLAPLQSYADRPNTALQSARTALGVSGLIKRVAGIVQRNKMNFAVFPPPTHDGFCHETS